MGRFWSVMFLLVPILGVLVFVAAAAGWGPFAGHWLPENIGGEEARQIDKLFIFILYLTGAIFIGTGIALFWFLWKYDDAKRSEKPNYMHGSHTLEIIWSILPAATLLFIAVYQMNAWADTKMRRPEEVVNESEVAVITEGHGVTESGLDVEQVDGEWRAPQAPLARVLGRQFEWRIQYAGEDKRLDTPDDIYTVNELHVPVDEVTVLRIESQDVLHSFFLPNLRLKQDVVPGMVQYQWFTPNKVGAYDIVCAELCGWGHYKMRGRLVVEKREKFENWLRETKAEQDRSQYEQPEEKE